MIYDELILKGLSNLNISATDIPSHLSATTVEEALALKDSTKPGELISLVNSNNLAEVLIYRRDYFSDSDPRNLEWDGKTSNCDWYDNNKNIYFISNAEQLAGLVELVRTGHTFEGKTIRLSSNINLNHKEWTPIGQPYYETHIGQGIDEYYQVDVDKNHVFRGTFDGCGRAIYGLKISKKCEENSFLGLFRAISHASIKNLILENVKLGSPSDMNGGFSALFGYAESSQITNIVVSGEIYGERISGIGGIAVDTSFYNCINRTDLFAASASLKRIVVGGIVQQVGLSKDMVNKIGSQEPNLFITCIQNGKIRIDARDATYLWAGQIYGYLAHDNKSPSHAMIIERCTVKENNYIKVLNLDTKKTNAIFYGIKEGCEEPANYVGSVSDKADLMDGLIGKTGIEITVILIKITDSIILDSLVIPGSVNTLSSIGGSTSFITIDTDVLGVNDGIVNLEPYFTFVKTAKS